MILASFFIHPVLFYGGLAAASVPIIIHLLNRRRFKVLDWAAMRFLLESVRKNRRRVRIEELILLALRTLAIVLLALAVSRFTGCGGAGVLPGGSAAQAAHVFILDDSASMGQKLADTTVLTKAANDLADMLKSLRQGDRVAILLTSQKDPLFDMNVLSDVESMAGRLKALKPADTTTQLPRALDQAAQLLAKVETSKRVYILSDFRKADFDLHGKETQKSFKALVDKSADVTLMAYGPPAPSNLTIRDVALLDKLAVAGMPARIQFTIQNNGETRAENVSVTLTARTAAGEISPGVRTIKTIEPGQVEQVQVEYVFADPGSGVLKAQLPPDGLAGDNAGQIAVDVREARRVLIVDGDPDAANPENGESFYLASALDPTGDHRFGNSVEVVTLDHLSGVNLDRYDTVMLVNVSSFPRGEAATRPATAPSAAPVRPYPLADALRAYVENGGGLAIFLGARVDVSFYNDYLFDKGNGVLPMRLGAPIVDRTRNAPVYLLRDSVSNDAVMRSFQGRRAEFTRFVAFYGYVPVEEGSTTGCRVLARYEIGKEGAPNYPAVVAKTMGVKSGTVMLVTTTADKEWTDWPKDFTYLSFVNDTVDFLVRRGGGDFTGLVGDRLDYPVAPNVAQAKAILQTPAFPAKDLLALNPAGEGASRRISYDDTQYAGVYKLAVALDGQEKIVLYARNVDPIEGQLTPATEAEVRTSLDNTAFTYINKLAPAAVAADVGDKQEYWRAALIAMLVVLGLEVFLGQRFGHYQQ